ncbi:hypothetical protein DVB69_12430 [Sporosarcina sp. BI001-red]|uniref:hypothetical protein n=1 Tax=Sporosarcina sp. BI001-red TaxID=2282866 RepID=UPI000E22571D|nr:hypothetical protein [Sporosarcina sp. BI001-red]REB06641.1 hypothetical protein DVB69_12430 [Sporosarcina sp. BI001-red]
MKKSLLLLFICVLLVSCQQYADKNSTEDSNVVSEVTFTPNTEMDLTLKEALEIAHEEALKWNKKAMLYNGTSVDKDKTPTGMEGRRKHWNIEFGIPDKTDYYLVTIRNGKVLDKVHLPNELKPMSKNYFISTVEEFKYDTPELLKKAQKVTKIYPGDIFAKGYNYGFIKDPEKNFPLVMVIGWDQAKKNMIYSMFNAVTGELEEEFEREQYKN